MAQSVRNAGSPPVHDDWPEQVAGTIVDTVDRIRGATVGPLGKVARGLVYGLIVAVLGVTALVLLVVLVMRATDIVVGFFVDGATMWIAYTFWGALLTLVGGFLLIKARSAGRAR